MRSNNKHWNQLEQNIQKALTKKKSTFTIKDTDEFPLAFNTEMPKGYEHTNGHISFLFKDFNCSGLENILIDRKKSQKKGNNLHLHLLLDNLNVKGKYEIRSKYAPLVDLDTAGNMLNYGDTSLARVAGAGSGNGSKVTPEDAEKYLDNAREQRTRLMDKPNGQKIMTSYNEHNEVYNEVFVKSASTRNTWNAQGATAEMAADTNSATDPNGNGVINSKTKEYSGGVTYNTNAFVQQLSISVNTISTDPNFNPWDPNAKPNPNSKYTKASLAALNFGKSVATTGNTDKKVTELTAGQVYDHVDSFSGTPPQTTEAELQNIIQQGMGNGGAEEAAKNDWYILDEEQRKMVRCWIHESVLQQEFDDKNISKPFLDGICSSEIKDVEIEIEMDLNDSKKPPKIKIQLPVFEFDIDDAHWTGKIATVIRERLAHIYFIKSLIHHQIEAGIKNIVLKSIIPSL